MTDAAMRIAGFYDGLVERYGHDPRACDYGSAASQRVKFEVLAGVLPLAGLTLLDVGCGFADYAGFLEERAPGVRYSGVDLSPRMIERARALRPELDLRRLDILREPAGGPYDVVTANGIFYLLGDGAKAATRALVTRMFELCRVALSFNSLSAWAPHQEPGEFYPDPVEVVRFCRTLTPWVTLRHDYLAHDFTVYCYRDGSAR